VPHNTPNGASHTPAEPPGDPAAAPQPRVAQQRFDTESIVETTESSDESRLSRLRSAIRRSPALNTGYRLGVAAAGTTVLGAGIAMLVLPGPGWAAIFVGLAILSTEFHWAHRLRRRLRGVYERAKHRALDPRVRRRNQVLAAVAVAIAAAVAGWYLWAFGLRLPF
jgi:uncharacterized protein (TIGR02611 family)